MANEVVKGKLFLKEVVARLKGDDAEAKGAKIARKAVGAVEAQIASLKYKKVDLDGKVEEAEEALNNAKFPTDFPSKAEYYIENILEAQKALDQAKENVEANVAASKFFTDLLDTF